MCSSPADLTLAGPVERELVERKSRFLAHLVPVTTTQEAEDAIRAVRAAHPAARHHCTALVLSGIGGAVLHRSSDDGEPSGTAGMPMLQALLRAQLTDTLAIVVRYFGGVKLGAGGLVRAYTAAVEDAAAEARAGGLLRERVELTRWALEVPFADAGFAESAVRRFAQPASEGALAGIVEPTAYAETGAHLSVLLPAASAEPFAAYVAAWSQGRFAPVATGMQSVLVPVLADCADSEARRPLNRDDALRDA